MKEIDYIILGQNIAKRRKELQISQEMLAELVEVSRVYISSIESGRRKIYTSILVKIANALKTTADMLLLGQQEYDQEKYAVIEKSIWLFAAIKPPSFSKKIANGIIRALGEIIDLLFYIYTHSPQKLSRIC